MRPKYNEEENLVSFISDISSSGLFVVVRYIKEGFLRVDVSYPIKDRLFEEVIPMNDEQIRVTGKIVSIFSRLNKVTIESVYYSENNDCFCHYMRYERRKK